MLIKNKKTMIICFLVFACITAVTNFYTTNLLLSDLGNMFYGVQDNLFYSSLPGFIFSVELTIILFMCARIYIHQNLVVNFIKFYSILILLLSIVGLIFTIITSVSIYDGLFSEYPFPGYLFICLILHLGLIVFSIYCIIKYWKEKMKYNPDVDFPTIILYVWYGLYSLMVGIGIYFALNRLGALILSPVYIQWRTLDLTWAFYVSLILPFFLVICIFLKYLDEKLTKRLKIILFGSITVVNFAVCMSGYLIGRFNPIYLSAISPANGLERLATHPYTTIVQLILLTIIPIYQLIKVIFNVEKKAFRNVNK